VKKKRRAQQSREASREYRKRKKAYIEELEAKVATLNTENENLHKKLQEAADKLNKLSNPARQRNDFMITLKEDWAKELRNLEELLLKGSECDIENIVHQLILKGKQLLTVYKSQSLLQFDYITFTSSSLFGIYSIASQDSTGEWFTNYWAELIKDLGLPPEIIKAIEQTLKQLRTTLLQLKEEQNHINEQIVFLTRKELLKSTETFVEMEKILSITTKMGEYQKNHESHWMLYESGIDALLNYLTPMQRARLILKQKHVLENMNILNSIWVNLNLRQT